jgi:hypothetical protein
MVLKDRSQPEVVSLSLYDLLLSTPQLIMVNVALNQDIRLANGQKLH